MLDANKKKIENIFDLSSNEIKTSVQDASISGINSNSFDKCSKDEKFLEYLIQKFINRRSKLNIDKSEKLKAILALKNEISTVVVPGDLNLDNLNLPFLKLSPIDINSDLQSLQIVRIESYIIITSLFIVLVLILILVSFIYLKGKNDLCKCLELIVDIKNFFFFFFLTIMNVFLLIGL